MLQDEDACREHDGFKPVTEEEIQEMELFASREASPEEVQHFNQHALPWLHTMGYDQEGDIAQHPVSGYIWPVNQGGPLPASAPDEVPEGHEPGNVCDEVLSLMQQEAAARAEATAQAVAADLPAALNTDSDIPEALPSPNPSPSPSPSNVSASPPAHTNANSAALPPASPSASPLQVPPLDAAAAPSPSLVQEPDHPEEPSEGNGITEDAAAVAEGTTTTSATASSPAPPAPSLPDTPVSSRTRLKLRALAAALEPVARRTRSKTKANQCKGRRAGRAA